MLEFHYDTAQFAGVLEAPEGYFASNNIIIDTELMNDLSVHKWDYSKALVAIVGFIRGTRMTILAAESEDDAVFRDYVTATISKLAEQGQLFAFNKDFERGVLKTLTGIEFPISELKPISGKGWTKDKCYNVLLEKGIIKGKPVTDIFDGDAKKVVVFYQRWKETCDNQFLMDILSHNINCLLKESTIHSNRDWFRANYNLGRNNFEVA